MVKPRDDLESPVGMLGQRRAALNPIAAIHVADAEILVDHRVMDMTANDTIDAMSLRFLGERLLECANIVDRIFDLVLGPLGQRPIAKSEPTPRSR